MNTVNLLGRITKDIELKYTPSQVAVVRITVAISRGKDKDGNDKGADFIPVTVFGRQAETTEKYLGKGSQIAIQGRIQTGSYEKDGKKVYTTDVIADRVEFIDKKNDNTTKEVQASIGESIPDSFQAINEDIPF